MSLILDERKKEEGKKTVREKIKNFFVWKTNNYQKVTLLNMRLNTYLWI